MTPHPIAPKTNNHKTASVNNKSHKAPWNIFYFRFLLACRTESNNEALEDNHLQKQPVTRRQDTGWVAVLNKVKVNPTH